MTQRDLLGSEPAYPFATLGELLFWHGDTDESEEMFTTALAIVDRAYDPNCRSWCLFGLCRIGVRRHDVEAVRHWSLQPAATVGDCKSQNFVASVKGAAAWVAWKDDRVDDVVRLANEALELWGAMSGVVFYFKGICLWPLMAVRLAGGDIAAAVEASGQILEPAQVRTPDELEALLEGANVAYDRCDVVSAASQMAEALQLACEFGYA